MGWNFTKHRYKSQTDRNKPLKYWNGKTSTNSLFLTEDYLAIRDVMLEEQLVDPLIHYVISVKYKCTIMFGIELTG